MTRAVLSLGSNLGDRAALLRQAVAGLGDRLVLASDAYETAPWPPPGPGPGGNGGAGAWSGPGRWAGTDLAPGAAVPPYLNAVVLAVDAGTDPYAWLAAARELERAAGRTRDPADQYAPRSLDVDVIMVWDAGGEPMTSDDPELTLPHPRAHLRAFVLRPWADIQPYAQLPGHGRVVDLLRTGPVAADLPGVRPHSTSLEA